MANVEGAYCALTDLRNGDLALPPYIGNGGSYVTSAAEEIDAALGHIYETPFEVVPPATQMTRPAILLLKKLNWLIASGRLVLDLAAAGESQEIHAYGKRMLDEGLLILKQLTDGDVKLVGAPLIGEDTDEVQVTGPMILNEDSESLVQSFYDRLNPRAPLRYDAVQPYGEMRKL